MRWPPQAEVLNEESGSIERVDMVLPTALYWNYVREYTLIKDRAVLNKRSGSTRFYAGNRIELDEAYLKKLEFIMNVKTRSRRCTKNGPADASKGEVLTYENIPHTEGEPGTAAFRVDFDYYNRRWESKNDVDQCVTDPATALELLRKARADWDSHLSKIASPSARLQVCLEVLYRDDVGGECPFLFSGDGAIKTLVDFHVSINSRALTGPADWRSYRSFPNTQLGYWVDEYLDHVIDDASLEISSNVTYHMVDIVDVLLEAGADVTPFLEPLQGYPHRTFYFEFFEPGKNILQCMMDFSEWFKMKNGYSFRQIDWLIAQLKEKSVVNRPALRFNKGDEVECRVGNGPKDWAKGTVTMQWYHQDDFPVMYQVPYQIQLDDDGRLIFAPNDCNHIIRRAMAMA